LLAETLQYAWVVAALKRTPLVALLMFPAFYSRRWMAGVPFLTSAVAISQATGYGYTTMGLPSEKIEVIHTGLDMQRYRARDDRDDLRSQFGIDRSEFVVLYAGRVVPEKGIAALIEAFSELLGNLPTARLIVAGATPGLDPASEDRYLSSLKQLAPGDTIWLDRQYDVRPLYGVADVVVMPSMWEEAFGRVLLEAMACERPVLASNVGGVPEVLSGHSVRRFLFEAGNVKELKDKLLELVDWQTKEPGLGRSLRAYVERNFELSRQMTKTEQHLLRATQRGPSLDVGNLGMFRRSVHLTSYDDVS
jgi:glycosyltransferase involved in cell wall biosynthesis